MVVAYETAADWREPKALKAESIAFGSLMKMVVAYETAADWREPKAMDAAFNAISWDDPKVQSALPDYLACSGAERQKVDYAFNAMIPRLPADIDGKQAMMHTWLKARLFSYNKQFPFEFGH